MPIRFRRPLALACVVTVTLAGAVVLRSALSDGDSASPPSGVESPSATQPSVPSPSPIPQPALTAATSPIQKRVFPAGEAVTVKDGIGFLSAADGSLETWSLPSAGGSFYGLGSTPDGALLLFNEGKDRSPNFIVDRATGHAWQLSTGLGVLPGAAHGTLVVVVTQAASQSSFFVANTADGSLRSLGITGEPGSSGVTSPDGRKVALQAGDALFLVDLTSSAIAKLASGLDPNAGAVRALPGALGFTLEPSAADSRRWFTWNGTENAGGLPLGPVSPNGKYVASEWSAGRIKAFGEGGYPAVSAVTVVDRQPNVGVAQFLGASAPASRFGDGAWTSASDGLVIEVASGYKLVTPAGQVTASFDDPAHVLNPRPSPTIVGLLGTDRGTIINSARNQTIAPKYADLPWHAEWTTRPGELAVQLATPGKGRSWPNQVLPFEARPGAGAATPRATVKTGGDCLNLREMPEPSAKVVRCLPDGTVAQFSIADDPKPDPKSEGQPKDQLAGYLEGSTIWLHLKLADGASGWADAQFLGWAK